MTDTSRFLNLLARVMQNKSLTDDANNKCKYNELYYRIHSELNNTLQKSMYPYTSDIVQKTEDMLDAIEPLYLCKEVVGKKCLLVSSHITTNIFEICKTLFSSQVVISSFNKIYTQIPIVIVDTDDDDSVEILNYANIRIPLTIRELKFMIIQSGRRKIALNKIIQFIIVKTKLTEPSLCIISDNIYSNAEKVFKRTISKKIIYIDENWVDNIKKRKINSHDTLLMSNSLYADTVNNSSINKYNRIPFSELENLVEYELDIMLYGFWEEYIAIETQIIDYYNTQLLQTKTMLQEVIGDIVRIGDTGDKILQSMRVFEEGKEKKLKSEEESISAILKLIENLVVDICSELGEWYITGKQISRKMIDDIFYSFFRCNEFSSDLGKKLLSKLYSYEYDNYELVTAYVQYQSGIATTFQPIEIKKCEWEKAKMLIDILNLEKISITQLSIYTKALGKKCATGKEWFAKALIAPEKQKQELLEESLRRGYNGAGQKLLDMYKASHREVNLQTLVNALVPEACMILADQKMSRYQNRKKFVDFSDWGFTYYKIAATNEYLPAIAKIVDIVFNSRFSSGFQIPADDIDNDKYQEMINGGHIICKLCNFLRFFRILSCITVFIL